MAPPDPNAEIPLTGGGRTAVVRVGDVVHRETGPWAPSVHALLRHLENVGFARSPRVVGSGFDERGRETLSYLAGGFVHPRPWADDAYPALGRMLRELHDATRGFVPPGDAQWRPWHGRDLGGADRVFGHGDTGPWNIVARDGQPVALIDWEVAGPVDRVVELAQTCWLNAQLNDEDITEKQGLPDVATRARWVRAILDGYRLPAERRAGFVDQMIAFATRDAAQQAIDAGVTADTRDASALWAITWRTRSAAWMARHRAVLQDALQ